MSKFLNLILLLPTITLINCQGDGKGAISENNALPKPEIAAFLQPITNKVNNQFNEAENSAILSEIQDYKVYADDLVSNFENFKKSGDFSKDIADQYKDFANKLIAELKSLLTSIDINKSKLRREIGIITQKLNSFIKENFK